MSAFLDARALPKDTVLTPDLAIIGGVAGGFGGTMLAHHLSVRRGVLNQVFAGLIFIVALYVLYRSRGAF